MDAAVDAMLPLGFTEKRVKKHVKQLLKVYDGDQGWPFIEGDSYRVLLDSMVEERDDEEQVTQNGYPMEPVENQKTTQLSDKSHDDEEPGCSRASDPQKDIVPSDIKEPPSAAVVETPPLPATSPPRNSTHVLLPANRRTRVPCYGWIESDEDDADEFIGLMPASMAVLGERATLSVTTWRKRRRSRWDVKPGDP